MVLEREGVWLAREKAVAYFADRAKVAEALDEQIAERAAEERRTRAKAKVRRAEERRRRKELENQLIITYAEHQGRRRVPFPPMYGNTHGFRSFSDSMPEKPLKAAPWTFSPREQEPAHVVAAKHALASNMPRVVSLLRQWHVPVGGDVPTHELWCAVGALQIPESLSEISREALADVFHAAEHRGRVDFPQLRAALRRYAPPPPLPPAEALADSCVHVQRVPRRREEVWNTAAGALFFRRDGTQPPALSFPPQVQRRKAALLLDEANEIRDAVAEGGRRRVGRAN